MARTFTANDLYSITTGELHAAPVEEQRSYYRALIEHWQTNYLRSAHGDDERVGSRQRQEWGQ